MPFEVCDALLDVNEVDVELTLSKVPFDDQVLDVHADLVAVRLINEQFRCSSFARCRRLCCGHFRRRALASFEEEGRGTRNGYEASKGSKGISGL